MIASRPSPSAAPLAPPAGATRAEEDRYLWQAFRHHSRTFSLAARLLRRDVRLPVATLYLYCRTVDTIADERVLEVGPEAALREVDAARDNLDRTLAGRPPDTVLWRRLAEIHERYELLPGPLHELLDGARWDLEGRVVRTTDDLLAYSELVAGSVGAMMLPFLVDDRAEIAALVPTARALGKAMQITNILRDVGEDLEQLGRLYLPLDALDRFGLTRADLLGVARNGHGPGEAYAALLESVMATSEALYNEAEAGIQALPFRSRTGIEAAARMYREIMNEVRAAGYDNLRRRSYVRLPRKLRLLVHDAYYPRKERLAHPTAPSLGRLRKARVMSAHPEPVR
jgi:phytoene synthase